MKKTVISMLTLAMGILAVSCNPEQDVLPSSVSVTPSSTTIIEGETTTLKASVLPADAVYSGIIWNSSDVSVASVNNGVVTGVKAGSATITASADGVSGTASVTVTARTIAVTGVSLDKTELELTEGEEAQLEATIAPDNATDKNVSWKSADDKVATVSSDGKVTAVAPGEIIITVTTNDGGKTATCNVKVLAIIDGALAGKFSVSATKQVRFSQGNLQATYDGSKYTWCFAASQYDYVGNAAGNTTIDNQSKGEVVDLFGWSTSATNFGINASNDYNDYSGDFVDWGKNIVDGSTWRTLSADEWQYLFKTRNNASGLYKHGVTVCGKTNCVILAPDGFTGTIDTLYDTSTWSAAEAAGLVCLPAVGYRRGSSVRPVGDRGYYWSSSAEDESLAYRVYFDINDVRPDYSDMRYYGYSVRLITESK